MKFGRRRMVNTVDTQGAKRHFKGMGLRKTPPPPEQVYCDDSLSRCLPVVRQNSISSVQFGIEITRQVSICSNIKRNACALRCIPLKRRMF